MRKIDWIATANKKTIKHNLVVIKCKEEGKSMKDYEDAGWECRFSSWFESYDMRFKSQIHLRLYGIT